MSVRTLLKVGLLAGGGFLAYEALRGNTGVTAPDAIPDPTQPDNTSADYLRKLSLAEDPSQDPYAKNPYSSASGLYQFTKATWTGLGGQWGNDPSKAFGGLKPTPEEQTAMAARLTQKNAGILSALGSVVNDVTLYAAHIFGASRSATVANADPSTPLASLVGASTVAKNPALGNSVASFFSYLQAKVG